MIPAYPTGTFAPIAGTRVSATSSEATMAAEMVAISSLNKRPTRPPMKRNGSTAARLVVVDATMALLTSAAESTAAFSGALPSRWFRYTFSSMTMVLSTSSPTPSASPPRVMMLMVSPVTSMSTTATMMPMGMALPMISVRRTSPRKTNTTIIASRAPEIAAKLAF